MNEKPTTSYTEWLNTFSLWSEARQKEAHFYYFYSTQHSKFSPEWIRKKKKKNK
jgi:endo-1,4-beta-D-glucanase Y